MTVPIAKGQRRQQRAAAKEELALAPLRIEVTNEEILADLRYPAPVRP